jgi:hypothetical protein
VLENQNRLALPHLQSSTPQSKNRGIDTGRKTHEEEMLSKEQ